MKLFDELKKKATQTAADLQKKAAEVSDSAKSKTEDFFGQASNTIDKTIDSGKQWAGETWNNKTPSKEELTEWAEGYMHKIQAMAKDFDADKMWTKISESAANAGQELVVMVLTMYYTIVENIKPKKSNGKEPY